MVSAVQMEAEVEAVELTSHGFSSLCSAPLYVEQKNLDTTCETGCCFLYGTRL